MKDLYSYVKIDRNDFTRLRDLFPNDLHSRLEQFIHREIDIYAIEYNGAFVGRLITNYINQRLPNETIPNRRVCLSHFILFKEHRNKGLGTQLLNFAMRDLLSQGFTEFTVGVEDRNAIAKHIYFKLGFTEWIGHGTDPCEYDLYLRRWLAM